MLFSSFSFQLVAQSLCYPWAPLPDYHKPSTPSCWSSVQWVGKGNHANAYELCNRTGSWALMFADEFNGNALDTGRWRMPQDYIYKPGDEDISIMNRYNGSNENSNYVVNNGTLKVLIKHEQNTTILALDPLKYKHEFTSGQLISWQSYPAGRYEVRCKIPYTKYINFAPLWLFTAQTDAFNGQTYYQELDIELGLNDKDTRVPEWTFHRQPPVHNGGNCSDGARSTCVTPGKSYADGNFHTMVIDWDPYRIVWSVDGEVFRTIYRTYGLGGVTHVNECKGPGVGFWYRRNRMMPLFTNMNIFSCAAVDEDYGAAGPNRQMEIDYIRAWRNIDCNKDISICSFTAAAQTTPAITPEYEVESPFVITGRSIILGGGDCKYAVKRTATNWRSVHQDVYATKAIYLNPGFSATPGAANATGAYLDRKAVFTAQVAPCAAYSYFGSYKTDPEEEAEESLEQDVEEQTELEQQFRMIDETPVINSEFEADKAYLMVYPNPARDFAKVDYILPVSDEVGIVVIDLNGRIVKVLESGGREAAAYGLILKTNDLNPGVYFVQMATTGGYRESKRLVVVR